MARTYSKVARVHRTLKVDRGNWQKGRDVKALQRAANARLQARGLDEYTCSVDGVYGKKTAKACRKALWALGYYMSAVGVRGYRMSEKAQRQIRLCGRKRSKYELRRSRKRVAAELREDRRKNYGRDGALRFAKRYLGTTENPPGSNRGRYITEWQRALGAWLVGLAWCGVFCAACLRSAGVKGISYRLASVAYIEDDARAGRGPFRDWTTDYSRVRRGDLVVIGGRGVHVEIVDRVSGGVVYTVGGNTSPGRAGSQSDGGGVFARARSRGEVHGFALVRF